MERWRSPRRPAAGTVRCGDSGPEPVVSDRHWPAASRYAVGGGVAFLVLAALVDWGSGGLTPGRAALWVLLGGAVFALLLPPRVVAGEGWIEVRTLVHRRRVRTDLLVTVRHSGAIATRLILRDATGAWVEVDPRVLAANPLLWHRLDTDARRAQRRGTLRAGADVLRRLEQQISGDQARAVFTFSGFTQPPGSGSGTRPDAPAA